jgi:hypothetical protein
MRKWTLCVMTCAATAGSLALAQDPSALAAIRVACAVDAQNLCAGVQPGGGRIIACLKEHKDSLSDQCKQVATQAANASGHSGPGAVATPPSSETSTAGAITGPPSTTVDASRTAAGSAPAAPAATTSSPVKSSHSGGARFRSRLQG